MALVVKDRVKETTATTGTGTLTLAGAVAGFQTFTSVLSNGDTTYYGIFESSTGEFEVGLGTFTSSGTTLARTTILESSNSGSAINLTAGAADVFITQPAEKAVYLDASDNVNFDDNSKAIFGAGSDLQIYHDGSHSYISDQGTGGIKVLNDSWFYINNAADTATKAIFKTGGEVELYYNGNQKFETTNTGIDVTGNIVVSGTVDGRDVATDGTKLDGIESGATTDQTKADIDALGINAATLDSLDSTQFLRSDANDTATGVVTFDNDSGINVVYSTSDTTNITGYGIISNRAAFYLRPTTDNSYTLYVGGSDASYDWSSIELKVGNNNNVNINGNTVWHAGNDGSGSTLDADLLDGVQGSSYLRSDTDDTFTGTLTLSGNLNASSNSVTALVINGNSYVYTPTIYLNDTIYHTNDTNTYINFATDEIRLTAGGSQEVTITPTGVQLGDTGNGYFRPVTGGYGSIEIDGGAHLSWEGYSIGGRAVFMHNNSTTTLIYDDVNDKRMFAGTHGGAVQLYHNGTSKIDTTSSGANIDGDLNAVDNIYLAASLVHEGDTDTFINFTDNLITFKAGNNANQYIASSYISYYAPLYNYTAYFEEAASLSGTTPTINAAASGVFYLTMSGNTTFTFTNTSANWGVGFVLYLTGNGGTVTWPASVDWSGGTAPDAPANGETDVLVFHTRDGSNWVGALAIDAAA